MLFVFVVIGQSDYFGFSFTTLNCQSHCCIIRNLLEALETEIISVQGYGQEKKTEIQHLQLRKNYCVSLGFDFKCYHIPTSGSVYYEVYYRIN